MPRRIIHAEHEGQTFSRTTDRKYTHVVIGKGHKRNPNYYPDEWKALNWCGRLDLAQKQRDSQVRYWDQVEIVEVKEDKI